MTCTMNLNIFKLNHVNGQYFLKSIIKSIQCCGVMRCEEGLKSLFFKGNPYLNFKLYTLFVEWLYLYLRIWEVVLNNRAACISTEARHERKILWTKGNIMNGSSVVSMLFANIENKATGNRTATQTIDVFKVNCERNLHNHRDLYSPQA